MRIIDYYFYLFFRTHEKVFGTEWMHVKRNVLFGLTSNILIAHLGLLSLCLYEVGLSLNIAIAVFIGLNVTLYFYTNKRFLGGNYVERFLHVRSEPKTRRRFKLFLTACLFPIHLLIYLNIHG